MLSSATVKSLRRNVITLRMAAMYIQLPKYDRIRSNIRSEGERWKLRGGKTCKCATAKI